MSVSASTSVARVAVRTLNTAAPPIAAGSRPASEAADRTVRMQVAVVSEIRLAEIGDRRPAASCVPLSSGCSPAYAGRALHGATG
ncbi:hypothetical protein [Nocardia wallacei]|nr:hypothetical protein [Nocardia wallacei]